MVKKSPIISTKMYIKQPSKVEKVVPLGNLHADQA